MDVSARYALEECIYEGECDLEVISAEWIIESYKQPEFNFDSTININWPAENQRDSSKIIQGVILLLNRELLLQIF